MKIKFFFLLCLLSFSTSKAQNRVAVGDILCTDNTCVRPDDYAFSGKTAMGVVFYVDNTDQHGWAVHLQNQSTGCKWSTENVDISGLINYSMWHDAIYDLDGYSNTLCIRNFGNATKYPAAWAVDFNNGWYLPSIGQFNCLYGAIIEINMSLLRVNGTPLYLFDEFYHTSTEFTASIL